MSIQTDEARFLYLFGMIMDAGGTIYEALDLASKEVPKFAEVARTLSLKIAQGESLRGSLVGHESMFSPFIPDLLDVGENTGMLSTTLVFAGIMTGRAERLLMLGVPREGVAGVNFYRLLGFLMRLGISPTAAFACLGSVGCVSRSGITAFAKAEVFEEEGIAPVLTRLGMKHDYCRMVSVGEETGDISPVCEDIAQMSEQEFLLVCHGDHPSFFISEEEHAEVMRLDMLSRMLEAGLPTLRSLVIMNQVVHGTKATEFSKVIQSFDVDLNLGMALAQAPTLFRPYVVEMVKAGHDPLKLDALPSPRLVASLQHILGYLKWAYLDIDPDFTIEKVAPAETR